MERAGVNYILHFLTFLKSDLPKRFIISQTHFTFLMTAKKKKKVGKKGQVLDQT